jgi:hypothetical protein
MAEGIILLVFEMKLEFKSETDHVAQVLLELVCESDVFLHKWRAAPPQEYKANMKQRRIN